MDVSVVIRTLNEARHLPALLAGVTRQVYDAGRVEIVVVDSGSTDQTLAIAESFQSRVLHIDKQDFSFGRSLNMGCAAASGEALVIVSGHCVPASDQWIEELVRPLRDGVAGYSYGRQIGGRDSQFSEVQIFGKYFPDASLTPQDGFFCNNANAALLKSVWRDHLFDEELTGLEDMHLGKRLVQAGGKIAYAAKASVYHLHDETWPQVRRRFEREALALQYIMPEVHVTMLDAVRYFFSAVAIDAWRAVRQKKLFAVLNDVIMYRLMQFWGSYRGNHLHRDISRRRKEAYFYPR